MIKSLLVEFVQVSRTCYVRLKIRNVNFHPLAQHLSFFLVCSHRYLNNYVLKSLFVIVRDQLTNITGLTIVHYYIFSLKLLQDLNFFKFVANLFNIYYPNILGKILIDSIFITVLFIFIILLFLLKIINIFVISCLL